MKRFQKNKLKKVLKDEKAVRTQKRKDLWEAEGDLSFKLPQLKNLYGKVALQKELKRRKMCI